MTVIVAVIEPLVGRRDILFALIVDDREAVDLGQFRGRYFRALQAECRQRQRKKQK